MRLLRTLRRSFSWFVRRRFLRSIRQRLSQSFRREPPLELGEGPRSVAIIMDGNGRWAASRGLPVEAGHREGTRALRRTVEAAIDLNIRSLTVYAFSTENWLRPPDEVDSLMEIFGETINRELPDLAKQGVRTRFIGRRDRVSRDLLDQMEELEAETASRDRLDLWIAFDYGGRSELADAAKRMVEVGLTADEIDEEVLAAYLYAPEMPEPDLLIRTSGELRISNFLLWQLAYAELVFTDRRWPEFGEDDLRAAIREYAGRKRRFGAR
jgi:undecaprenyl diphosphate synthase